jgi:hypothetical protein
MNLLATMVGRWRDMSSLVDVLDDSDKDEQNSFLEPPIECEWGPRGALLIGSFDNRASNLSSEPSAFRTAKEWIGCELLRSDHLRSGSH